MINLNSSVFKTGTITVEPESGEKIEVITSQGLTYVVYPMDYGLERCDACDVLVEDVIGWREFEESFEEFYTCESCNGIGTIHTPDFPVCSTCNGDGVVSINENTN